MLKINYKKKLNINWEENKYTCLKEMMTTEQQSFTHSKISATLHCVS